MKLRDGGVLVFICFLVYGTTLMWVDKRIEKKIDNISRSVEDVERVEQQDDYQRRRPV